jgi:hypothetical protein
MVERSGYIGQPTPTPWMVEGSIYEHMAAEIVSVSPARGIAQIWKHGNAVADAAHIVRCVNAHETLCAALNAISESDGPDHYTTGEGHARCIEIARRAVETLKGAA